MILPLKRCTSYDGRLWMGIICNRIYMFAGNRYIFAGNWYIFFAVVRNSPAKMYLFPAPYLWLHVAQGHGHGAVELVVFAWKVGGCWGGATLWNVLNWCHNFPIWMIWVDWKENLDSGIVTPRKGKNSRRFSLFPSHLKINYPWFAPGILYVYLKCIMLVTNVGKYGKGNGTPQSTIW